MLQINGLKKYYGTNLILDIPYFTLPAGIFHIAGTNGSGKTTLLKIIAALLNFRGTVTVNDVSLKENSIAYRQQVSWAEAEPLYPSFLTGKQLLWLYADIRKVSVTAAESLAEDFYLTSYLNRPIGEYSAGMIKKLSLCLAFMGDASLVLLDEPFITLDDQSAAQLSTKISARQKENGTSFLITSHQEVTKEFLRWDQELYVTNKSLEKS